MSSSIFSSKSGSSKPGSSDPAAWRRFARTALLTAGAALAVLYAFVAVVDPWDTLPLSPPLPRVPISSNARFSFPALARDPRFDAVVLGTSTARLLQPAQLDPLFHARFANLAMNSATAWEQARMLQVFLHAHPRPRAVLIGLDAEWCGPAAPRTTGRPFPEWMYGASPWRGYREILTPYAVQEAANQFAVVAGLKRQRYGGDGYTPFVPDDAAYDTARVDAAFARWPPTDPAPARDDRFEFPAHALLRGALDAIPPGTRTVLFFVPYHASRHGAPGTREAARWSACKEGAATIARAAGAELLDFLRPSAITEDRANYWDPLHYRVPVAARLARALALDEGADFQRLVP